MKARQSNFDCMAPLRTNLLSDLSRDKSVAFSIGNVVNTYIIAGRLYADVDDYDHGCRHDRCPVMCFGGDTGTFTYAPVTPTAAEQDNLNEAIILHRTGGRPYIIGMKQPIGLGLVAGATEDPGAEDRTLDISKNDIALVNKNAKLIIDSNGAVTIVTGDAKYARVQLQSEGGRLRISRGGEANETVILANAFLDTWVNETLHAHLQTQNARITALEAQVAALSSVLVSGVSVTGLTADEVPVTGTTVPPSGLSGFSAPTAPSIPTAGSEYKSSTIELSEKSLNGN